MGVPPAAAVAIDAAVALSWLPYATHHMQVLPLMLLPPYDAAATIATPLPYPGTVEATAGAAATRNCGAQESQTLAPALIFVFCWAASARFHGQTLHCPANIGGQAARPEGWVTVVG